MFLRAPGTAEMPHPRSRDKDQQAPTRQGADSSQPPSDDGVLTNGV
ncbi:hypothetical protein PQR73_006125 [Mycobacterium marinum]|nr:hypothetical protein [Mycobacterium marinum]WDZ15158.1 hypothetical protein PQR73_006125 [Mycobacterium marinum]